MRFWARRRRKILGSNFGVFDDFSDFSFLLVNADPPPRVGGCPAKTTDLRCSPGKSTDLSPMPVVEGKYYHREDMSIYFGNIDL